MDISSMAMLEEVAQHLGQFAMEQGHEIDFSLIEFSGNAQGVMAIAPLTGALYDLDLDGTDLALVYAAPRSRAGVQRGFYTLRFAHRPEIGDRLELVGQDGTVASSMPAELQLMEEPEEGPMLPENMTPETAIRFTSAAAAEASAHGDCWVFEGGVAVGHGRCWIVPVEETPQEPTAN